MIQVNEAYNLIHELLCQPHVGSVPDGASESLISAFEVPIETVGDYTYVLGLLLLEMKLDDWSLDDAYHWVTMLLSDEWMASAYAQHPQVRANLLFPCSTLAGRLWGVGMKGQAQEVHEAAERALRVATEHGLYHGGGLFEADKYIKGGQRLRIVLNHRHQADNALRMGLISDKRYQQAIERFGNKKERSDSQEEALRRYVSEIGFLQGLPTDQVAQGRVARATLIPEPGYFDERLNRLSDDQQAEYLRAFGTVANLKLVRKYTYVRLASLLQTMILYWTEADFEAIERECRQLASIQDHLAGASYEQAAEVARYLSELEPFELGLRCEILRGLDEKTGEGNSTIISFSLDLLSGSVNTQSPDSTFRIRPDPRYFEIIRLPMDRLKLAQQTGATKTRRRKQRNAKSGTGTSCASTLSERLRTTRPQRVPLAVPRTTLRP